jgi:Transposase DDE domain
MSKRILTALRRLRHDLRPYLDEPAVGALCNQLGHRWRRDALLSPFTIILWFVVQVLHGNTALTHITLKARRAFTESAYCQARARLPLAVFRAVLRFVIRALVPRTEVEGRWRGHRTFLVDGSSFSMPDTPELQQHFGQPGGQAAGCGFPVAKILALFHAGTGLLLDVIAAPLRTHDMSRVDGVHPTLQPGDVLVGDRGFCSFPHLALLLGRGVHAVFRVHQQQIVDFTPGRPHAGPGDKRTPAGRPRSRWLRALGAFDQVVEWFKPKDRPAWMTAEQFAGLPGLIMVRELRYTITRRGFRTRCVTLVTTLLDAEAYPLEALAELYGARWRVEQYLRDLKQTMKMDVLRCKTVDGVLKELMVYGIVYNLVRLVMGEAARRQRVAVDRISFIDALGWLLEAKPGEAMPRLVVNPSRPGRFEPRVRKRRPKEFPVMKKPRRELRKALSEKDIAA